MVHEMSVHAKFIIKILI